MKGDENGETERSRRGDREERFHRNTEKGPLKLKCCIEVKVYKDGKVGL